MKLSNSRQGMSVVEVVVATAILLGLVVAVSAALQGAVTLSLHTADRTQASLLLEEGAEALLLLRDQDWEANLGSVDLNSPYSLHWNGSAYVLSDTLSTIDGQYRREVVFTAVRRDNDGALDDSGDIDPGTLLATMSVYLDEENILLATANTLIHDNYAE